MHYSCSYTGNLRPTFESLFPSLQNYSALRLRLIPISHSLILTFVHFLFFPIIPLFSATPPCTVVTYSENFFTLSVVIQDPAFQLQPRGIYRVSETKGIRLKMAKLLGLSQTGVNRTHNQRLSYNAWFR